MAKTEDAEREYTLTTGTVTRWEDGKIRRYKAGDRISMTDAEAQRSAHKLAPMQGPATVPIRPMGLSPAQSNSAGIGNPVIAQESMKQATGETEEKKSEEKASFAGVVRSDSKTATPAQAKK